jgi:hypothetical protein
MYSIHNLLFNDAGDGKGCTSPKEKVYAFSRIWQADHTSLGRVGNTGFDAARHPIYCRGGFTEIRQSGGLFSDDVSGLAHNHHLKAAFRTYVCQ